MGRDLRAQITGVKCLTHLRQPYSDLIEMDSATDWLRKQRNLNVITWVPKIYHFVINNPGETAN